MTRVEIEICGSRKHKEFSKQRMYVYYDEEIISPKHGLGVDNYLYDYFADYFRTLVSYGYTCSYRIVGKQFIRP